MPRSFFIIAFASALSLAVAQAGPWDQCGGLGYTGPTTCVPGYGCAFINEYYSQCFPGIITDTWTTTWAATTTTPWADPVPTLP